MPNNIVPFPEAQAQLDRAAVESRLELLLDELAAHHEGMREAVAYSLLGAGKRLRPLLVLWTHDALSGRARDVALDAACAIECIHTYSLVHDDLPCMDDDDLRRGKPSSHRRFDEGTAVLVGDELLNLSYEILATFGQRWTAAGSEMTVECIKVLSAAAGTGGLITGQALDLSPPLPATLECVERIHENKTARMIAAAMELGAVVANAGETSRGRIRAAGTDAGIAFQIIDDLLDLEADKETLGKTPGKDIQTGKVTYPSIVGPERARRMAGERIEESLAGLPDREEAGPLRGLVAYLADRRA